MNNKALVKILSYTILLPLGAFLVYIASSNQAIVESLYSRKIYPAIGQFLSKASGLLPFSLAELAFILVPAAFIAYTSIALIRFFTGGRSSFIKFLSYAVNILSVISIGFFTFIVIWGLNYYRMPFASIAGLEVKPASVRELEKVCELLIDKANELRQSANTDPSGRIDIPGSSREILKNCRKGYEALAPDYPVLSGSYGDPKPVLLSKLMNYTGICGIYFPFTGEANVNISIPESSLPSTASHEMAHQRGFAREDEANYISYLACTAHPDVNYKYSGVLLALTNSMNALHKADPDAYNSLSKKYSESVRGDLKELNNFWKQYEGLVERTSERINNTYLKANNQRDGVQSYGRMVDLLIAEYLKSQEAK